MIMTLAKAILFAVVGPRPLDARWPRPVRRRPDFALEAAADARINRWTGRPHEHRREISRRLRQLAAR